MNKNVHLALRFNSEWWPTPSLKVNTIQTHRDVINHHGTVWWGKFGSGISETKFNQIKNQIKHGVKTYAYFFENAPFNGAFVAKILDISNDYFDTNHNLIPSYYRREARDYKLFFEFDSFSMSDRNYLLKNLVLLSNPTIGSLENAFRGSTSLFYVSNNLFNTLDG